MTCAAVTGASGFIGAHVVRALRARGVAVIPIVKESSEAYIREAILRCDVLVHLAGVNRATAPEDFVEGNQRLTEAYCRLLEERRAATRVIYSSSKLVGSEGMYGRTKEAAEEAIRSYVLRTGAEAVVLRLPNVFGPQCRPNYNSVVATFCHNVARDLPIAVHDPDRVVQLVFVGDVATYIASIVLIPEGPGFRTTSGPASVPINLGDLAARVRQCHDVRQGLVLPNLDSDFARQLYGTYVSYLAPDMLAYDLEQRTDARGTLAEFVRSRHAGQMFVSRTVPGITRGNHFHEIKAEKFFVMEGEAIVRFRRVDDEAVTDYFVTGGDFRVIDVPPGYTHSIENVGTGELVVLFWASEEFNPIAPDTWPSTVSGDFQ